MVFDGGDAAAWSRRTEYFGRLIPFTRGGQGQLGMELLRPLNLGVAARANWDRLRALWGDLDYTFPIIDVLHVDDDAFLLRYAAIDWRRPRLDTTNKHIAARWLVELADVYKLLVEDIPQDVDAFCAPLVHVDLDDHLRVAFTPYFPPNELVPPEVQAGKRWDERGLVFLVGRLFERLVTNLSGSRFETIYRVCVDDNPANRWPSLSKLIANVAALGINIDEVRERHDRDAWRAFEEGLGWLHLGYRERAAWKFEYALTSSRYEPLARWGIARAGVEPPPQSPTRRPWPVAELPKEPVRTAGESLEIARQALHAGDTGYAGVLASTVLENEPGNVEAMVIIAQAHLRNRHFERALKQIENMPESGRARYLRGKALLGLGRLHEARDAFDRSLELDPKLVEAMLLRREADRTIRLHHRNVGEHKDGERAIPDSLAEIRDVLLSGDAPRTIAVLSSHPYSEHPQAQLLLAHTLAFTMSHASAIAAFERAAMDPDLRYEALVGKARSLHELGHTESALALFDVLTQEQPTDPDASEGRARALEKLSRLGEAAAEFRRFISLATGKSDVRVRVAADWLREHPL